MTTEKTYFKIVYKPNKLSYAIFNYFLILFITLWKLHLQKLKQTIQLNNDGEFQNFSINRPIKKSNSKNQKSLKINYSLYLILKKKVFQYLRFLVKQVQQISIMKQSCEEEEDFNEQTPSNTQPRVDPNFTQLQAKITTLISNPQQAKFLLRAASGISNGALMASLIQITIAQNQIFKIDKSKIKHVADSVKAYYEKKITQSMSDMSTHCGAYKEAASIRKTIQQKIVEKLENLDNFRENYFQNVHQFEQAFQSALSQLRDLLSRSKKMKENWKNKEPSLKIKLNEEVINILSCFLPKNHQTQINEVANKVSQNVDCQEFLYEIKNTLNGAGNRVVTVIKNLDSYNALKQYGVEDINQLKKEFTINFYDKFAKLIPFSVLRNMIDELLKNPLYYFTSRQDLSDLQKKGLVKELWLNKESILLGLIQAHSHKQTLQYKINQDIQKILYFLVYNCKFNFDEEGEIEKIKQNLQKYDLISFFDKTPNVSHSIKKVYQFIMNECKDYLRGYNGLKCTIKLKIEKQLKLKIQLQNLVEHIPYSRWSALQQSIMIGQLDALQRHILNEEAINTLRTWIKSNLSEYIQIIKSKQPLEVRVRTELIDFFVKKEFKLSFSQISTLTDDLLKNPCYEVIQSSQILTDQNKKEIKLGFPKLKELNDFNKFTKIDQQHYYQKARAKIQDLFDSLKLKMDYKTKSKIINCFLREPKDSTIYEEEDISEKSKRIIVQNINKIAEVKEFIQKHDMVRCIYKKDAYLAKLQSFLKTYEFGIIKQYVSVFGQIQFKDGKIIIQTTNIQLADVLKSFNPDTCQRILQAQSSNQFKDFYQELPSISMLFKEESENRLMQIFKKLLTGYDFEEQAQMIDFLRNRLKTSGASNILKDQRFNSSRNNILKMRLEQQPRFKCLLTLQKNIASNRKKFAELNLKKKIRELYHHQALINTPSEQKVKIIASVQASFEFDQIKRYRKITDEQKESLIKFIQESKEYTDCKGKDSKTNVKPLPEVKPQKKTSSIQPVVLDPQVKKQAKQQVKPQVISNPAANQQEFHEPIVIPNKNEILKKWDDKIVAHKQKSLYKNFREKNFADRPLQFIELVLKAYPWSEQTVQSFFKTGSKKTFVQQLNTFARQILPELQRDVEVIKGL